MSLTIHIKSGGVFDHHGTVDNVGKVLVLLKFLQPKVDHEQLENHTELNHVLYPILVHVVATKKVDQVIILFIQRGHRM